MCGIAGIVDLAGTREPATREALLAMVGALRHRGPDGAGLYRDPRAGLAHTRLAIVDLAAGAQPLANEDETLWIVFNGEIFNYPELREELRKLGHSFRTQSDTEVIVHAYEAWGEEAFTRFNGQWALALWDARRHRLVLSRDPLGICPLYLHESGGVLTFASEVKAIFASNAAIRRQLDPRGIDETFTFWSVVAPQSVFVGISELPPGTVRTYAGGQVWDSAYYRPDYPVEGRKETAFQGTLAEAAEQVRGLLERAARLRLQRSDVPVGCYLSGGLDSSFLAALGRDSLHGAFQTFSLRFEDPEYDETDFQRQMVRQLGSTHHELVVKRSDIGEAFPEVIFQAERPILRSAPAPLFCLSKLVRERGIKVVLTGEGADEMFAGYDLFREGKARRFWAKDPSSQLRPRVLERLYPYLARSPVTQRMMSRQFFGRDLSRHAEPGFAHGPRWQSTAALKRLYSAGQREAAAGENVVGALLASLPAAFRTWGPLQQDQYLEIRTLLSGYLLSSQGDRMLMAHSVEGRFPFLDPAVVAFAASLPANFKLRVLDEKHVLKRAAQGIVPPEIVNRKKQPYRSPDAHAFAGKTAPAYVEELLGERSVNAAGIFEAKTVAQLLSKCRTHPTQEPFSNADNMALVGVLSTQLVHHQFVSQRPEGGLVGTLDIDIDRLQEACL